MMRLSRLLIALLVAMTFSVDAQEPRFFRHDIGEVNAGLRINCMMQDHQCMMWLGTARGLARYDGMTWFDIPLIHADSSLSVSALFEDRQQRIWIGTSSGRIFFMDKSRRPQELLLDEGHPAKPITAITQDIRSQLWFATYGEGVYVYTGSRLYNLSVDDGLSAGDIYAMASTPGGKIWLGTDNGISICSFKDEKKDIRKIGLQDGLPDQIVTALQVDLSGNVWIGTFEYGVVFYQASSGKIIRKFAHDDLGEVTSFSLFDDKEIWIGTRNKGAWRFNPGMADALPLKGISNIGQAKVTCMYSDIEGNQWVALEDGMLISGFRPFESFVIDLPEIQALFADSRDQLWIGTQEGLFMASVNEDHHTQSVINMLPDLRLNVTSMLEDSFHLLWIGTLDKGLYVFNPSTKTIKHFGSIFENGGVTIMSMAATPTHIYVATLEGVVSFPASGNILKEGQSGFQLLSEPWQSNLHFVFQVFTDSRDRVWFATDGNGVFVLDKQQVTHIAGDDRIKLKTVYSICEDHRGYMWFNTPDQGLVEYDGKQYAVVGLKEGLSSLNIASVYASGTGDIIITHDKGIDLLEPDRRHFMYYDAEIGIANMSPGLNAGATGRNGEVWTSGQDLLLRYYAPEYALSIHPRTQITEVKLFDRKVDFQHENYFSHGQNYFTFLYTGLWYTSPTSVKYQYKLEGYDLQWKESRDNVASYSNLAPGTYTFVVKASENKFFLDEPTASYTFTIAKPFWREFWFIGLLSACCIAGLVWLVKAREKRSERQALHKKDIIESQLAALKAQINPHFLFNSFNTLITIIDENPMQPQVAIEYVEKLSDFFRNILQYREQETIPLEEEWELVNNYVYLLQKRYGHNLRLHMDSPTRESYIMPLTLQMLVENAVKHNVISEKYPLDIFVTMDPDGYITVKNNLQVKSKPEASTQFGLDSIVRRYQLLSDKQVIVKKTDDMFIVRIPVIKK